jgi:uncharacterized protein (TIGR03790 family)
MVSRVCVPLVVLAGVVIGGASARADVGPENVMVVVNRRHAASQTIANHFIQLRGIPDVNVCELEWEGSLTNIDVDTFRTDILLPVVQRIDARGLGAQIDCIVYSAGFPYAIDFDKDVKEDDDLGPTADKHRTGSLTGMTYLSPLVMAKEPKLYSGMRANWYARPLSHADPELPTRGFSTRYQWDHLGEKAEKEGQKYILSAMLAYTDGRGNTVDEALAYLQRSAAADATEPKGTVYFMKHGDIRSKTREPAFDETVAALHELGIGAEVVEDTLPRDRADVLGVMLGSAEFDFASCDSTILPGAICENLTSLGGILRTGAGQTPLSELLRFGAAGSSGTVTEPYALQPKFPHPRLFVHYARGCTLAEAYYQSVQAPYQLLVVGDPLCRPWVKPRQVVVEGWVPGATLTGILPIKPSVDNEDADRPIDRFELFVDGRLITACKPGGVVLCDTAKLGDGHHEFRIVAVEGTPIETRSRLVLPITVDNEGRSLKYKVAPEGEITVGERITIEAECEGAKEIVVLHHGRPLGKIDGASGSLTLDVADLGTGPVSLALVALGEEPAKDRVTGAPLLLNVTAAGE